MTRPLTVYTVVPFMGSASFYYRITLPLDTAAVLGLPLRSIIDRNDANVPAQDRARQFCEADIVHLYQPIGESPINNIRGVQNFVPSLRDGDWKYPPTIVVETDDNLLNVSPLNQAFKSLGIRDMAGNMIPLGHHVGVVQGGERKILWYDTPLPPGQEPPSQGLPISLSKNRQAISSWRKILELADVVQCSTPNVEKAVRKEVAVRRSKVLPNLARFDHYPQVSIANDPDKVYILWQGGIAHYEDWYPLREQLGNIVKKYPQAHFVIWGALFPWVNELIPPHRYTFIDWCAYHEYKLRLVTIGHDIALAPLSDNVFNECRSGIKLIESAVLKKPAALLAQNTGAYKAEVIDEQTGLLFNTPEEFEEKLSRLIEDVTLRKTLAANAKQWVSDNRDAMKEVPKMVAFWEELREERKLEQPHVTDALWKKIEAEDLAEQQAEMGVTEDAPVPALNESG